MQNLGSIPANSTIDFKFNTHQADGTPVTLSGSPAVSIYKDNSTTQTTTGVTLTVDFDAITGLNNVNIVATNAFYAAGHEYDVVITQGTVDGVNVAGALLAHFSIENRPLTSTDTAAVATAVGNIAASGTASDLKGVVNRLSQKYPVK
jgi:hypothetical protein